MQQKRRAGRPAKKARKRNLEREVHILESALRVFGEKGFEATTISAISSEAGISDATVYEYFKSKEDILFSIPELYTRRELERMQMLRHFVRNPRERLRVIIQAYLEFYEGNPLYTSVALLTLKGNRSFLKSPAYETVREASRTIVETYEEGVAQGVFRGDVDGYLVRNLVLGFIEHLTIQWLHLGRPHSIAAHADTLFDMVVRAVEKDPEEDWIEVKLKIGGPQVAPSRAGGGEARSR